MKVEISDPERTADVEAWMSQPGQGDVVKDNRVRTVRLWKGLYIKEFKHQGVVQRLRSAFFDRARHEFRILKGLQKLGVDAAAPVAWARNGRSTFLFTREIAGAQVLRSIPLTRDLLRELARFVRRLHDAGLRDEDLHIGNILRAGGKLHLIDVHRASLVDALTPAERVEAVAFVVLSFYTFVSQTDVLRFIREYGADPLEVGRAFQAARERYYLDREARVRSDGSDFQVVGDLILRRPCSEESARKALAATPLRVIKETPNRRLWLADGRTFVKEGAPALWHNGFALETRGIPTPRLLATQGNRVAGEWLEGAAPLWDHFKSRGVDRDFLRKLARLVRRMHRRGVYHRDLKANNLLVRGEEIFVVDLDRVDFSREVGRHSRIFNLAQLNAAVGAPVTRADRLRFFFAYAGRDRAIRTEWKPWVREVMKLTIDRRHVWPSTTGASSQPAGPGAGRP